MKKGHLFVLKTLKRLFSFPLRKVLILNIFLATYTPGCATMTLHANQGCELDQILFEFKFEFEFNLF